MPLLEWGHPFLSQQQQWPRLKPGFESFLKRRKDDEVQSKSVTRRVFTQVYLELSIRFILIQMYATFGAEHWCKLQCIVYEMYPMYKKKLRIQNSPSVNPTV